MVGRQRLDGGAELCGQRKGGQLARRLADPSHWLHLQLFPIHGLDLVEGGMGANDHKGGS